MPKAYTNTPVPVVSPQDYIRRRGGHGVQQQHAFSDDYIDEARAAEDEAFFDYATAPRSYLYALVDPRDGLVRYIGRTRHLHQRRQQHRSPSRTMHPHEPKWLWVCAVRAAGRQPTLIPLEQVVNDVATHAEVAYIQCARRLGCPLLNREVIRDAPVVSREWAGQIERRLAAVIAGTFAYGA